MNEKELEKIYNEAYRAVYWTAMRLLKNEADAEDVVQDVFITLIESYDTIEDKSKVIPWLKKATANKCLNRLTRNKTDAVGNEFFDNVEAVPEDFLPEAIIESAETRKIIMEIIEKSVSEDVQKTLILFYFDEMSTREIAESLGVPEGTVRSRLNFARNKIKKEVLKYEKESNTKLLGMAVLPFLSKLFIKEAEQVALKPMPGSLTSALSASAKLSARKAEIKIAAKVAKKGTSAMTKKIVVICASVATVGAITGGILFFGNKDSEGTPGETIAQIAESDTQGPKTDTETETSVTITENTEAVTEAVTREVMTEAKYVLESKYEKDKLQNFYEYDDKGVLIKEHIYYPIDATIEYQYNGDGLLENKTEIPDSTHRELKHTCYEYDAAGNIVSEKEYYNDEAGLEKYYTYEGSNLVCIKCVKNEKVVGIENMIYDGDKLIEKSIINSRGVEGEGDKYVYNDEGVLLYRYEFACNTEGTRTAQHIHKYEYDEKGQLIAEYYTKKVYKMDVVVDVDNIEYYKTDDYRYDENGNLVDEDEYDSHGKFVRNKHYTYIKIGD